MTLTTAVSRLVTEEYLTHALGTVQRHEQWSSQYDPDRANRISISATERA